MANKQSNMDESGMTNKQSNDTNDSTKRSKIFLAVVSVFSTVVLIAIVVIGWQLYQSAQAEKKMRQLAELTWTPIDSSAKKESEPAEKVDMTEDEESVPEEKTYPTLSQADIPVPEKYVDISALQAEANADIYSWIYIPDTGIDYPVLQHPEELDYYLKHNIDGRNGYPGCIYTQRMNSKDWMDKNTVIYGHNMGNGTMFAHLHYYEDATFFEENPYIYIYTEDTLKAYRIFAAYEYSDRHVLLFNDISTDESYLRYLDSIFEMEGINNNFDTEMEFDARDRIITLSTCIKNKETRRYLVQAVLVAEESSI